MRRTNVEETIDLENGQHVVLRYDTDKKTARLITNVPKDDVAIVFLPELTEKDVQELASALWNMHSAFPQKDTFAEAKAIEEAHMVALKALDASVKDLTAELRRPAELEPQTVEGEGVIAPNVVPNKDEPTQG